MMFTGHRTMMLTGHQTRTDQTLNNDWEITRRLLDIEWWCLLTPKKARPDTYWWLGNTVAPKSRCWTPRSIVFTVRQNQIPSGNHGLNRADRVTSFDVISISVRRKNSPQYRTTGVHLWSNHEAKLFGVTSSPLGKTTSQTVTTAWD